MQHLITQRAGRGCGRGRWWSGWGLRRLAPLAPLLLGLGACQPAASEPAPAPTPVDNLLQVLDDQARPIADVAVAVHDDAGALVELLRTDAEGRARVEVPPGGTVSTFQSDGQSFAYIDTVAAPPGGVPLHFRGYRALPNYPAPTALQLTLEGVPPGAATIGYTGSCGSGAVTAARTTLPLSLCLGSVLDVVLIALDAGGNKLGWGGLLELPAAPGKTIGRTVSLGQSAFARVTLEVTDVPPGPEVTAILRLNPEGPLRRRLPGLWLDGLSMGAPPEGRLLGTLAVPQGLGKDGFRTHAGYDYVGPPEGNHGFSSGVGRWQHYRTLPERSTFSAGAIPQVRMDTPDVSDRARPRVSWRGGGGGDVLDVYVQYATATVPAALWELWAPPEHPRALRLPELPPELAAYRPAPGREPTYVEAVYTDFDEHQGYEAYLRARAQLLSASDVSDQSYSSGNMVLR